MRASPRCLLSQFLALCVPLSSRAYTNLSDSSLRRLPSPGSDFNIHTGALLAPILQPRVPGTPGSVAVLNHFVSFFRASLPRWTIELQNSTSKTPATGDADVPFVNLIARRDPPWSAPGEVGRLTLVAHYDSLSTPPGFVGAIDSAAPCAMILHAVRSVDAALTRKWAAMEAEGVGDGGFAGIEEEKGVQVLLLDGEEAFVRWTDTDSLYGARSLAETWEQTLYPALSTYRSPLAAISLFLLLDLLGSSNPSVPSYYKTTHWAYQNLCTLETRLRALSLFKSSPNHPLKGSSPTDKSAPHRPRSTTEPAFLPDFHKFDREKQGPYGHHDFVIGDDHLPFLQRGVEVVHLIPSEFPLVWHRMEDDGEHLDLDTVEDWALLVTAFVAEWMDLEAFLAQEGAIKQGAENAGIEGMGKRWVDTVISKTEL